MGFYNLHNSDYLLLCGLCGLFELQIIWVEATYNPHFIIRVSLLILVEKQNKNTKIVPLEDERLEREHT